jgi:hypothetical protein
MCHERLAVLTGAFFNTFVVEDMKDSNSIVIPEDALDAR